MELPVTAFELGMILTRQRHHARLPGAAPAGRWVAVSVVENGLGYPVAAAEPGSEDPAVGEEHVPVRLADGRGVIWRRDRPQPQARPDGA
jgi:hypothetical protein